MYATAVRSSPGYEPPWLDDDTLRPVRTTVRALLESSPGFRALPSSQQLELARNMVRVGAYMANPDGLAKEELTPGQGNTRQAATGCAGAGPRACLGGSRRRPGEEQGVGKNRHVRRQRFRCGLGASRRRQLQEVHRLGGFPEIRRRPDPERVPGDREGLHPADERVRTAPEIRRPDRRPVRAGQHIAEQCARLAGRQIPRRSRDRRKRWLRRTRSASPRTTMPTR